MADYGVPFQPTSNENVLNAIRNTASSDYRNRIPQATQANYQDTVKRLLNNVPDRNEFVNALVNRIGLFIAIQQNWDNPYGKFKRGMLEFGDTIEEVMVGLAQAYTYDTDRDYLEQAIFGQETPEVQSSFHKINRQNFYKITVKDAILRRAFVEEGGLSSFILQLMAVPVKSDNWDEYLSMTSLFRAYYDGGGFFKINVPNVSIESSDKADSNYFLRRTREMAETLPFISRHYNAAGMPVHAMPDDLELFITPQANAAIDVESLAAAFNTDKAKMPMRTNIIPQEHMNIPGAQAILTTKDFFVVADSLYQTTQMVNPVGLHENHFLHHHQVMSVSRFVPALLFTTEPGDVITLADTPVTSMENITLTDVDGVAVTVEVERGNTYIVAGGAITTPTGGTNDAARWELEGNAQLSPLTRLTQTGTLLIGYDENATSITIKAIAVDDNEYTKTLTLPVVGDKLRLWDNPAVLEDSDDDGLFEVVPEPVPVAPTSGADKNKVKIPKMDGVDYKDGGTTVSGTTLTLTANKTITAVAQTGYEIKTGANATWNLVFTA